MDACVALILVAGYDAYARKQLLKGEWLDQIIVAAYVQPVNYILHGIPGSKEQHRGAIPFGAYHLYHLKAVYLWQHYVHKHSVVAAHADIVQRILAVQAAIHTVARSAQLIAYNVIQVLFVFHNEYAHGISP